MSKMALSNVITTSNWDENKVKEIKILLAVIKSEMTAFIRFLSSGDGKAPGLLLDKLEIWIGSTPDYPIINKTSELALIELTGQIIAEAVKPRTDLCEAFSDYKSEDSSLIVL